MIGRMFFVNPNDIESLLRYFSSLGLLQDDKCWYETLIEAPLHTTDINRLRLLFVMILGFGAVSRPADLWEKHKFNLRQDILYRERQRLKNDHLQLNNDMINLVAKLLI